jgi:hypothetical protein
MERTRQLFLYSQFCLYVGLAICIIIKPRGLTINNGISYYGTFKLTIIPYCFALFGSAFFCLRGTQELSISTSVRLVHYVLLAVSILIVGIVITPYTISRLVSALHETIGSVLFSLQLLLSLWLIVYLQFKFWAITLTVLEFAAGVVSLIYLAPRHGYLLESQIIFQICFGILLISSLPYLVKTDRLHAVRDRR